MSGPEFHTIWLDLAEALAKKSTCSRLQVGCVITSMDNTSVFSIGYNGNAAGLPNQCDSPEEGNCGDLHAETNAIIKCSAPRSEPKRVYVTHLPCPMCAKMLVNLGGVKEVHYRGDYRIRTGVEILLKTGIQVFCHHEVMPGIPV